jgi:amino acid transporter
MAVINRNSPASILIAYTAVGFLVYIVMTALGEMAAWIPHGSGFAGYATRFCDPALGFALGWTYWCKYIITTPNQLTASALIIQEWVSAERVNPGIWILIFLVVICAINYFGIKFFGELEFWLSSFKVVTIVGVILLSFILAVGGGPGDATGFKYYSKPGAFKEYIAKGDAGRFYGFWSSLVNAVFAYLGTELIGVTVGEAQNPRKTIPRAIKLTFYRILFFYCLSVFFLGMLVPYDSPELAFAAKARTGSAASPFVVAIKLAGIKALPDILNACILVFTFSASNSDLYIASRTIYGLAEEGHAPKIFRWTDKRGVPVPALAISALFCCTAFMNAADDSKTVFGYFVNLTTIFGLLSWISLLVSHIWFVRARRAQGITNDQMAYVAPFGLWGSIIALFFCCLIALTKNFNVFTRGTYGSFDYKNFVTGYLVSCNSPTKAIFQLTLFPGYSRLPHLHLRLQVLHEVQGRQAPRGRLLHGQGRDRPRGGGLPGAPGGEESRDGRQEGRKLVLQDVCCLAVLILRLSRDRHESLATIQYDHILHTKPTYATTYGWIILCFSSHFNPF